MTRWVASWGRVQRGAAVALVALSLTAVALRALNSPAVPFLFSEVAEAPWIAPPAPVSAQLEQWGEEEAPRVVFERAFGTEPGQPAQAAALEVRALRRFAAELNGEPLTDDTSKARSWREPRRIEIGGKLRAGRNVLRIEVRNLHGPALLSLRSEGLDPPVQSDTLWQVSRDGRVLGAAVLADDTRPNPAAFAVETPVRAISNQGLLLGGLFVLGAVVFGVLSKSLQPSQRSRLPAVALGLAFLAWLALFAAKFSQIPLAVGFDATNHLAYLQFLRSHGRLPLATDGWSMYHPPFFYVASWGLGWLGEQISAGPQRIALKLVPFLSGLGNLAVAYVLARRLFPADFRVPLAAVVFAAVLPMNLYGSAYFSNEMPHAFLVGLGLVATIGLLRAERVSGAGALVLGVLFGLAALTKFTALILLPIALFFLAAKLVVLEGAGAGRAAGRVALAAGGALAVAGWFYARTWIELGQPVVGNWNTPGPGHVWWQQPGFHTLAYYTGFGESFRHPYLAGFVSFWDGIYSTLWGDGGVAGRVFPIQRHTFWNYDFMTAGFLLAIPATAVVLFGAARCVWLALRDETEAGVRAGLTFLTTGSYAVGLAVLTLTMQLPFFAQAKAFYALCMSGPLALFFAVGLARCDDALAAPGLLPARIAFHAWWILTGSVLFLGFAG